MCRSLLHPFTSDEHDPGGLTVNPYAGCAHRCVYCYATYEWSPEFYDTIYVKANAPEILARELAQWRERAIPAVFLASATDAYQPAEGRFRLTRRCVEVLQQYQVPYYIFTKSGSVVRDYDLHSRYRDRCLIVWSLTTLNEALKRRLEPYAAAVAAILRAMQEAAARHIPTGVNIDPIIPGLTDAASDLQAIVRACVARRVRYFAGGVLRVRDDIWLRLRGLLVAMERDDAVHALEQLYFARPRRSGPYFRAPDSYEEEVLQTLRESVESHGAVWGLPVEEASGACLSCAGFGLRSKQRWREATITGWTLPAEPQLTQPLA
jgi:DNA repair photolyase